MLDNTKSAKEYISESYAQELVSIQAKAKLLETPASIIEKEKTEKIFEMADNILGRDILSDEVTQEYSELLDNIQAKKEELKKLYGIETAEDALQAVKNAKNTISEQFTQELAQNEADFTETLNQAADAVQEQIDAKNEEADKQVQEIKLKTKDTRDAAAQEAKREKEEYDYQLARSRKQAAEERAKAVSEREKALVLKETEARNAKQECLDKLAEIDKLSAKVDGIPAELEAAKAEGAKAKEKELGKEYGYKKYLADKDSQNAVSDLQEELDALQKKYDALCKEKAALSATLEDYNAKNYQLAVDTAKSVGGINILNTDNHLYSGQSKK